MLFRRDPAQNPESPQGKKLGGALMLFRRDPAQNQEYPKTKKLGGALMLFRRDPVPIPPESFVQKSNTFSGGTTHA